MSLIPRGKKIAHLRKLRELTQEELAIKTGYSKRTIERIESSINASKGAIEAVADVLSVSFEELVEDLDDARDGIPVEIVINEEFYSSPEEAQQEVMQRVLEMVKVARVVTIRYGSIILTIEVPEDEISKLLVGFEKGWLADWGVTDIRVASKQPVAVSVGPGRKEAEDDEESTGEGIPPRDFFEIYRDECVRYVKAKISSNFLRRFNAEDIVQDAFISMLRLGSPVTMGYVLRVLETSIASRVRFHTALKRSMRLEVEQLDEELVDEKAKTGEERAIDAETINILGEALRRLPAKERQVMNLLMQGISLREIVSRTKLSKHAVRRAINKFRKDVASLLGEEE